MGLNNGGAWAGSIQELSSWRRPRLDNRWMADGALIILIVVLDVICRFLARRMLYSIISLGWRGHTCKTQVVGRYDGEYDGMKWVLPLIERCMVVLPSW